MSILGMGTLEILVILLVAFIVMGPERMTDAARLLGKSMRELKRLGEGLPRLMLDEEEQNPSERSKVSSAVSLSPGVSEPEAVSSNTPHVDTPPSQDGDPVAFESSGNVPAPDETRGPRREEKA